MQSLKSMMTMVGNRVPKTAAENVAVVWEAINRADYSQIGKVTLDAHDFSTLYKYMQACAKKAGVI